MKNTEAMKVFILADDDQVALLRMLPDRRVRSSDQTDIGNMDRTGIRLTQGCDETVREILVE